MIHEEYEKLLKLLEQTTKAEEFSLEEILKEAVVFFETLRKAYPSATKEKQEEMMEMMNHLHARLQEISAETAKASGMSEDELSAFAENPSNFTPEQWQLVQQSRRELYDSARKFSASMESEGPQPTEDEEIKKGPKPIKKPVRRARKKGWMKS